MQKLVDCILVVNSAWIFPMPKLSQTQELRQQLTPKQILQASLLQLNLPLLEQRILHELEINPALEMIELSDEFPTEDSQNIEKTDEEEETVSCFVGNVDEDDFEEVSSREWENVSFELIDDVLFLVSEKVLVGLRHKKISGFVES